MMLLGLRAFSSAVAISPAVGDAPHLLAHTLVAAQCNAINNIKRSREHEHRSISSRPASHSHSLKIIPHPSFHHSLSALPLGRLATVHAAALCVVGILGAVPRRTASSSSGVNKMAAKYASRHFNVYVSTPEQLVAPYLPPDPAPSFFSVAFFKNLFKRARNILVSTVARAQARYHFGRANEKFSNKICRTVASNLYADVNKAIAQCDLPKLKSLVTEPMYTSLIQELGLRAEGASASSKTFQWTADLKKPDIISVRIFQVNKNSGNFFTQVVVHFRGTQTLQFKNADGEQVERTAPVNEFWAMERRPAKQTTWRLCAKPTHQDMKGKPL